MKGYTLDLIGDINTDCVFSTSWKLIGEFTGCDIDLNEVCSTDDGDVYMVGELPLCSITTAILRDNNKYKLQVYVTPHGGSLESVGDITPWLERLQQAHRKAVRLSLEVEGVGNERFQKT